MNKIYKILAISLVFVNIPIFAKVVLFSTTIGLSKGSNNIIIDKQSLVEAIKRADPGDIIEFQANENYVLKQSIVINSDNVFDFNGSSVSIDSSIKKAFPIFSVEGKNTKVTIKNVTATPGINTDLNSVLSFQDSTLLNQNAADNTKGRFMFIGSGCTAIVDNVTVNAQGGVTDDGGDFYVQKYANLNLDNVTILGGNSSGNGGCIYGDDFSVITINKGSITKCSAVNGGIFYLNPSSQLILKDVEIDKQSSTLAGKATNAGGCIYANDYANVSIDGGTIEDCEAKEGGGILLQKYAVIYIDKGLQISNCTATDTGGAIDAYDAELHIGKKSSGVSSVYITNCTAANGGAFSFFKKSTAHIYNASLGISSVEEASSDYTKQNLNATNNGGAIYIEDGSPTITISKSIIACSDATQYGGAIFTGDKGNVSLVNVTLAYNNASKGSAIYADNDSKVDVNCVTVVYNFTNDSVYLCSNSTLTMVNSILTNNGITDQNSIPTLSVPLNGTMETPKVNSSGSNVLGGTRDQYKNFALKYDDWTYDGISGEYVAGNNTQALGLQSITGSSKSIKYFPVNNLIYCSQQIPHVDQTGSVRSTSNNSNVGAFDQNHTVP